MLNIYDYISNGDYCKTFKVNDLLWVEYKCLIAEEPVSYWTHNNYFAYILSGSTKYKNGDDEFIVNAGDALFIRKGTYVATRNGNTEYCALVIFVPDEFIRKVSEKYPFIAKEGISSDANAIFPIEVDACLSTYFHSVLSYFPRTVAPHDDLLKIKFEELLLNIFTDSKNHSLGSYLRSMRDSGKISIRDVMEGSFMFPMSLQEYARLSARSLSSFKSDFQEIYKQSPGKWLIKKRIEYASQLLENTEDPVREVALKSGFKNTAHFVKVFKETYGTSPLKYRTSKSEALVGELA